MIMFAILSLAWTFTEDAQPIRDVVITESVQMSGTVHVSSFVVARGGTIYAADDLTIISHGPIEVEGVIVAADGNHHLRDAGRFA